MTLKGHSMRLLTRGSTAALAATLALGGVVLLPAAAHAAPPILDQPITLQTGHIDAFTPVLTDDGSLQLAVKEDVTPPGGVLRTPESVELFVKAESLLEFPDGYVPGLSGEAYHLPLTQNHNLIWPGWETQLITSAFPDADTDIVVSEIEGPGKVFLWSQSGFGSLTSLLRGGGYELPATISQPYPAHTHAAWAFTEPGTYKLTVRADVTASDGKTASTQNATYTFVVAEQSRLTPEAPVQSGTTVTIPEQKWVSYTDSDGAPIASGDLALTERLDIVAHPALGFAFADGAPAHWSFEPDAPAQQTLEIEGLRHHYHQGSPISLQAVASDEVPGASYEWFIQRKDQSVRVPVPGAQTSSLQVTAEQAYDDAAVSVRMLDAAGAPALESAPVIIDIDDHGAAPYQSVSIEGVSDHYHTGSVANLSATVEPESVLTRFEWQLRTADESDWRSVPNEHTNALSFTVTDDLDGAQVRALLTFDDGSEYVASAPVHIEIDYHHGGAHTELSISGLESSYRAGDSAKLRAVQSPETGEDHYHWFIKRHGAEAYTVIPGALSADLDYTVLAEDAEAQLVAKLYDHDHRVIAESSPVTLHLDASPEPGASKPESDPAAQTGLSLEDVPAGGIALDRSSVTQGGTLTVTIGAESGLAGDWIAAWMFSNPTLLGGDWQQVASDGTVTLRVPADATPGAHRLAVFDRTGTLVGWQPFEVTPAGAGTPVAHGLVNTGSEHMAPLVAGGVILLLVGAAASLGARRRMRTAE